MASEADKRAALAAYLDCWAKADRQRWLELFADDAVIIDPVGSPPHEGKEKIAAFWDRITGLGITFEPDLHRTAICGDEGMMDFTMVSRMPGGNSKMIVDIVDVFTFNDDGKFTKMRAYWDSSTSRSEL